MTTRLLAARCETCRHWRKAWMPMSPPWLAARPSWGECDAGDELEVTSEYDGCTRHATRPPGGTP